LRKILLVSNEAARTGAPAILLGIMQWLKAHTNVETISVLMRDGAMRAEFERIGRTYTWIPIDLNQPERIYKRVATMVLQRGQADPGTWLAKIIQEEQPDIIYLSTLVLGKYLVHVPKISQRRVVTHVHELLPSLRQLSSDQQVSRQLALSDSVIACAPCVAQTLTEIFQLPPSKCTIIPEYISPGASGNDTSQPPSPIAPSGEESTSLTRIHQALDRGIPIFGVGGNPIHRKGFDLFPLLVKECQKRFAGTPFLAVWIGCGEGSQAGIAMEWDLTQMGLQADVALIPSVSIPTFRWIVSQFRVLTLLSREDPFPLVVLEAGVLGVPTVCFEGSGAIPEMAAEGNCVSVPYLDLQAYAEAVHRLCVHPEEARGIAARCRQHVERHLTLDKVAPRVVQVLLNEPSPQGETLPVG
jgi:glycosyltransferase involved in cell wall biosynthesis